MSPSRPPFPADKQLKKPVCVFCGSSPGSLSLYGNAAKSVGKALANEGIPLVYGGGRRGLMGVVSSSALEAGGYVHGILPKALVERASEKTSAPGEVVSQEGIGKDLLDGDRDFEGRMTGEITSGMHERKMKMAQYSTGGFIVLPGGYGTFEEMMEMITWNQLGIHQLPVIVLNIGNFYAPVRSLLEGAVAAGFILEKNLALVQVVDLDGGKAANFEEARADEWGPAVIKALKEWTPPSGTGYGLNWDEKAGETVSQTKSMAQSSTSASDPSIGSLSLFSTMRYTNPAPHAEVEGSRGAAVTRDDIPLWPYHIQRLQEAYSHFAQRDGEDKWGGWPGEETIWENVRTKLADTPEGDWRVRLLLHPGAQIEVQALPAPADAGPFQLLPCKTKGEGRPLMLDPQDSDLATESPEEIDLRLYKTTNRAIYDEATARTPKTNPRPEILIHSNDYLLETATSNIAIQSSSGEWLTPHLDRRKRPFLDGVMRRYLIERGVVKEAELTVGDYKQAKRDGRRVIGCNGLRGVWEADMLPNQEIAEP